MRSRTVQRLGRRIAAVTLAVTLSALVTAAPATGAPVRSGGVSPAAAPLVSATLPGLGPAITRAEILARAQRWVDLAVPYSQNQSDAVDDGTGTSYRPDCSGYVSMAWRIPKKSDGWDLNTGDFAVWSGSTVLGSYEDLLPGDALLSSGHMVLFDRWANNAHTQMWVYQEPDWGRHAEHVLRDRSSYESGNEFTPRRYRGIVETEPTVAGRWGDFNGDGRPDFAGVAGGDLWVHRGSGSPGTVSLAYSPAPVSSGWGTVSKILVADMDGDGKSDLIGFNGGDQLMIWRSTSTATTFSFAPYVAYGSGWSIFTRLLPLADYNGDGKPDFAAVAGGDLWIHRNTSTPGALSFAFSNAPVSSGWSTVSKFSASDMDGDGKADIIGFNGGDQLMIWRSTSTSTAYSFAPYVAYGSGWGIFNQVLPFADYNGDGKPDFAGLAGGDLWIHRNNSTPGALSFAFSNAPVSTGWGTVSKFSASDMDGDGKADIIGYNGGDQLMIWRSTSTSTAYSFAPYVAYGSGWSIFNRLLTTAPTT